MRKYEKAVKQGIDLLNTFKPTWLRKIDIKTLNMGNCDTCILGQIYGNFFEGMQRLEKRRPKLMDVFPENDWFTLHGFDLYYTEDEEKEFKTLQREWIRQIKELQS